MHRKFIALILSGALAVTGMTAQSARADDTAEWIAGAAALAIIGLAIADANKKPKVVYQQPSYQGHGYGHGHGHSSYGQPHTHGHAGNTVIHQPKPRSHNPKALPRQCRVKETLQGHVIRGLSKRCLKRHNVNVKALPRDCAVRIPDPHSNKRKVIFGGRCLRNQGYSIARAH